MRRRVGLLCLVFGAAYALFIVAPPFLVYRFAPYPLLFVGDVVDLATPIVLVPLSWLLYRAASPTQPSTLGIVAFLIFAAVWAQGQGMHLGANAINHLVETETGDLATLVDDLDEGLSHYLWHAALLLISALTIARGIRGSSYRLPGRQWVALVVGAVLFGATFFAMVVEGGTWPLTLPVAALLAGMGALWPGGMRSSTPAVTFFVLAYSLAIALTFAWAAINGWEVIEFSKVFGF